MIEYNVEQIDINKNIEQEKRERLCNNKLKCLEMCIKILTFHLEKKEYEILIQDLKKLSKKKQQSGFVILGIIKFSLKIFYPRIQNEEELLLKYMESIRNIFQIIRVNNDPNFDILRKNLMKAFEIKNWDEIQHLIFNFEYGVEDKIEIDKNNKKITCETADFNTESSTKLDNKLEISLHKESASSTRNLNLVSPMSKVNISQENMNLKMLKSDHFRFSRVEKGYKIKLPHLSLAVDITMSAIQIKKLFIMEMSSLRMNLKGDETSNEIIAEKREIQFFRSILECFHISTKNVDPNSVQLSIKYSDNKYERVIELKSLTGKKEICESMIISFVKSLVKKVKKMRILRKSEGLLVENIIRDQTDTNKINNYKQYGPSSPYSYQHLVEEDNSVVDYSNKETSNFYEFYRILSQDNYDLGKSVSDFVEIFRTKYKNTEISKNLIPKPMEEIVRFIDDCVSTFHCYFNFGKSNTEKMLPYCRPAVEKFIFNKVYFLLYDIYDKKYQEENHMFLNNQNNLKLKLGVQEIMEYLEIKKKFRGENNSNYPSLPYKSTIDCINKVEFEQTPKDKFDCLMKSSLELRNGILDITKGKSELISMDDELPLFIYLTTQINVKNMVLEIAMVEDYLLFSKSLDKESKVLTNLKSSIFYITNDWKLE